MTRHTKFQAWMLAANFLVAIAVTLTSQGCKKAPQPKPAGPSYTPSTSTATARLKQFASAGAARALPPEQRGPGKVACGPPDYPCSLRQSNGQLTQVPLPNPIPTLSRAGDTFVDTRYGQTWTLCTDPLTDPTNRGYYSFEECGSGGANDVCWSHDGLFLSAVRMASGTEGTVYWDPAAHKCSKLIPGSITPVGSSWSKNPATMHVNYVLQPNAQKEETVVTAMTYVDAVTPPTSTTVWDFRLCPGLQQMGPVRWHTPVTVVGMDDAFLEAFSDQGQQDTGEWAAVWLPATNQCHVINTQKGTYDGQPLPQPFYPFLLHDAFAYNGGWATLAIANNSCPLCPVGHGPYLWLVSTNQVQPTPNGTGHATDGNQHYYNAVDAPAFAGRFNWAAATTWKVTTASGVSFPQPFDVHAGYQNADPLDLVPFWWTEVSIPKPPSLTPVPCCVPLQGELAAADPGSGLFYRWGQVLTSGVPVGAGPINFRTQFGICTMSGNGERIACTTDWMGKLGNTSQPLVPNAACQLGSPPPQMCQSQVVVMEPQ